MIQFILSSILIFLSVTLTFAQTSTSNINILPIITIDGTFLRLNSTGERFFVRGVTWLFPIDNDNEPNWKPALDSLKTNAPHVNNLRIAYGIDQRLGFDKFMDYTAQLGFYVQIPLTPTEGPCVLDRYGLPDLNPPDGSSTCYPSCLLTYAQILVNIFSKWSHVMAFIVGDEVVYDDRSWNALPCVKSFIRDLKAFMGACTSYGQRQIPLMYSSRDGGPTNLASEAMNRFIADYLSCGGTDQSIDIFSINIARWCSPDCMTKSADKCGYDTMRNNMCGSATSANGIKVPLLFTYGCSQYNKNGVILQREWLETQYLFSSSMNYCFAGANAHTYSSFVIGESFFVPNSKEKISTELFCASDGTCNLKNYQSQLLAAFPLPSKTLNPKFINTVFKNPFRPYPNCATNVVGVDLQLKSITSRTRASDYTVVQCRDYIASQALSKPVTIESVVTSTWAIVGFIIIGLLIFLFILWCQTSNFSILRCRKKKSEEYGSANDDFVAAGKKSGIQPTKINGLPSYNFPPTSYNTISVSHRTELMIGQGLHNPLDRSYSPQTTQPTTPQIERSVNQSISGTSANISRPSLKKRQSSRRIEIADEND